jgi:hypothetical protein
MKVRGLVHVRLGEVEDDVRIGIADHPLGLPVCS